MGSRELEICIEGERGAAAAIEGGANRVELCAALALGGLTPSPASVDAVVELCRPAGVAVHILVRPRPGDFIYDPGELRIAADDARLLLDRGVDGLVFGATRAGRLDRAALAAWVATVRTAAPTVHLTLHRAIDATADPAAEVETAVQLGFDHILTSGGAPTALQGAATIRNMVEKAGTRCTIMAGSGVHPDTAAALLADTGVSALHASASRPVPRDPLSGQLGFDTPPRRQTRVDLVRSLRRICDA